MVVTYKAFKSWRRYIKAVVAQVLINVMWQGINMVAGFSLDGSGSFCVFVLWTAP